MYEAIGIHKLSENQLSRLRNGHPVRIKLGNHHRVHLSVHQLNKLHSAHKRNKAYTVQFDPYQMEAHGSGFFGDIATKAKQFIQKHHLQHVVNPLISGVKNAGHRTVERVSGMAHRGINRASHLAHSHLNHIQPIEGHGMLGDMAGYATGTKIYTPAGRGACIHYRESGIRHPNFPYRHHHLGGGLGGLVLNGAAGLSNLIGGNGSGEAADVLRGVGGVANFLGLGVARKQHHTAKKRVRKSHHHGSGFLDDVAAGAKSFGKNIAKSGVDYGADFIKNKISGLGIVKKRGRIVGRKKTHSGGALLPAGY